MGRAEKHRFGAIRINTPVYQYPNQKPPKSQAVFNLKQEKWELSRRLTQQLL